MTKRLLLLVTGSLLATGCVSIDRSHAVATPWAVAGVHSFAPPKAKVRDDVRTAEAIAGFSLRDFSLDDYELDESTTDTVVAATAGAAAHRID